jgi:hypothetical protein
MLAAAAATTIVLVCRGRRELVGWLAQGID